MRNMTRKILYIGQTGSKSINGMDAVNSRNVSCLRELYGDSLYVYEPQRKESKVERGINMILGNLFCLSFLDYKKILNVVVNNKIEYIFLAHSGLGNIGLYLKKKVPTLNIITFFHNIEKQFVDSKVQQESLSLSTKYRLSHLCKNENKAVKHSDVLITLNKRDSLLLEKIYSRKSTFELPTSFTDKYSMHQAKEIKLHKKSNESLQLLFVGVNFFANTQGVEWFVKNVLTQVTDVHLTIVGRGMDSVFQDSEYITVKGFVDDLSDYYYSTDIVVVPIFTGGGMKTKTAEALMYRCPIIASKEGFEGYDMDHSQVGGLFNSAEEAIELLIKYRDNRYLLPLAAAYSNEVFKEKYTFKSSVNILKKHLMLNK